MKLNHRIFLFFILIVTDLSAQSNFANIKLNGNDVNRTWHVEWAQPNNLVNLEMAVASVSKTLSLTKNESLEVYADFADAHGQIHYRLRYNFNGTPVLGSEFILHTNKKNVFTGFNGHLYRVKLSEILVSEKSALELALNKIQAHSYKWQIEGEDSIYKVWTENPNATYFPKSILTYIPRNLNYDSAQFALCHAFDIYAEEPHGRYLVFVNITTGAIWGVEERIHIIDAEGLAKTRYSGQQRLTVDSLNATSFRLRETARGGGIETYNLQTSTKYASAVDFTDTDNFWDNANSDQDEVATDAHWGAQWTYDYYWNKFARNSYDGNGAKILSYIHYSKKYNNAFWNGNVMTYGDGDSNSFTPLTSIDVCGHEITHAITTSTAGLIYKDESGALNESFSDIFGNAIEIYAKPASASWKIGEDITPSGNGIRHMNNPNGRGHPDTYKGKNWKTGTADNGGVHSNSGVQNYWFYLLCEGGSGKNDNGDNFNVDSIGVNKAEAIAYRNLTVYLTSSSNYSDARYFAIRAAEDLFGSCSQEVIAVTNAWYAVGVGAKYDSAYVSVDFEADTNLCQPGGKLQFVNKSSNVLSYKWYFGNGQTSTDVNPTVTYTSYGKFTVKLVGTGCFFGSGDSIEKSDYITIDSTFNICNATKMTAGRWDTVRLCTGYVYDNGGEENYKTLIRDTLTINAYPSDSMVLTFSDFDFEDKFDSLYIYDGPNTNSPLIGGYTGNQLQNGGKIVGTSGYLTLRQFADPFLTGKGFKAFLKTYRAPLALADFPDSTVCFKQPITLTAKGSGGFVGDYRYFWNGKFGDSAFVIAPEKDTIITVILEEFCTKELVYDTISLKVLAPLEIDQILDTTVCFRQKINLEALVSGGLLSSRTVTWIPIGKVGEKITHQSDTSVLISAVLSDNCSGVNDTTFFNFNVLPKLEVKTVTDSTLCYKAPFELAATGTGGRAPYTFSWDNGLGIGATKNIIASNNITYRVLMSDNCSATSDSGFVSVTVLDSIGITMSPDTTVCYAADLMLLAKANGGDSSKYKYAWNYGLDNSSSHVLKPKKTNTYVVRVSDGCSGIDGIDSVIVTVLDPLDVKIVGKDTACYGEQIFFTSIASGGIAANYNYQWSNGMGNNSSASVNAIVEGNVELILSEGCSGENDTAILFLNVRTPLSLQIIQDSVICSGDSINIWAMGSGGILKDYQYFWDNGGGNSTDFILAPVFTTQYKVTLFDNCSSFVEDSVEIAVNPKPKIKFKPLQKIQCTNIPVDFINNTPGAEFNKNFWKFGDGKTSKVYEPQYAYKKEGKYDVSLKVTNQFNCSDSLILTDSLAIIPEPVAFFNHEPEVATIVDPFFDFKNLSQHGNSYLWNFGDAQDDTLFDVRHTYDDTGYYEVRLTVTNTIGCVSTFAKIVRVKDIYLSHIPNSFSPNEDGLNAAFKPFLTGLVSYKLTIFNRWGQQIYQGRDISEGWDGKDADGKPLMVGYYLYRIVGNSIDGDWISEAGSIYLLR